MTDNFVGEEIEVNAEWLRVLLSAEQLHQQPTKFDVLFVFDLTGDACGTLSVKTWVILCRHSAEADNPVKS